MPRSPLLTNEIITSSIERAFGIFPYLMRLSSAFGDIDRQAQEGEPLGQGLHRTAKLYTGFRQEIESFRAEFDRLGAVWSPPHAPSDLDAASHLEWLAKWATWFLSVDRLAGTHGCPAIVLLAPDAQFGEDVRKIRKRRERRQPAAVLARTPDPSPGQRLILDDWERPQEALGCEAEAILAVPLRRRTNAVEFEPLFQQSLRAVQDRFHLLGGPAASRSWTKPLGFRDPWNASPSHPQITPIWDSNNRELRFGESVIRDYSKKKAPRQEAILTAFQEAGWPRGITVKFKAKTLGDTVDDLNHGLDPARIVFRRSGMDGGVIWEPM